VARAVSRGTRAYYGLARGRALLQIAPLWMTCRQPRNEVIAPGQGPGYLPCMAYLAKCHQSSPCRVAVGMPLAAYNTQRPLPASLLLEPSSDPALFLIQAVLLDLSRFLVSYVHLRPELLTCPVSTPR
jgi:hypothetical protein